MQLHQLQSKTKRKHSKRIGRGGKRGTTSGKGTKGQRSRTGASIKPGFRGGDNRMWQAFPKRRGSSSKPGNSSPHPKHRFYQLRHGKPAVLNLSVFNKFSNGEVITPELVLQKGLVDTIDNGVKILGDGNLIKKLEFKDFMISSSAKDKIEKAGSKIN